MKDLLLPILVGLITALLTALVSAVITYFATRSKIRLDLLVEYDKKLRTERLDAYKLLWKELKPLARYSAENPLTYEIVRETAEKLRDWYFDDGGIYLSRQSRKPYFDLKNLMQKIIDDENLKNQKEIPQIDSDKIIKAGTILRKSLSDDIGTRRESFA